MNTNNTIVISGLVVDHEHPLTLAELSRACCMHAEWVIELVDEGILEPAHRDHQRLQFSGGSLRRALVVRRLQQDLGINLAGAALALDLMDEMETLRARLEARSCR